MPGGLLRVVQSGALEPTLNMGLDEALLTDPDGPPTLRYYGWSPPGLSIGYFQTAKAFADVQQEHVLVRRLTGGGAIWHEYELTLALTGPADLLPSPVAAGYELLHEAVRKGLARSGVGGVTRLADAAPSLAARSREDWCFAVPAAPDLVTRTGRKLFGSAQRRIHRPVPRVLHHASLMTGPSRVTPFVGSLAELGTGAILGHAIPVCIAEEVAAALGLRMRVGSLSAEEIERGRTLARTRYADPAFTYAR